MRTAAVIGAGFGGIALAIRLQSAGVQTVLFEARDKPGGRAYVYEDAGFTFDAGPTVITDPSAIEEVFAAVRPKAGRIRRADAGLALLSVVMGRRLHLRLRQRPGRTRPSDRRQVARRRCRLSAIPRLFRGFAWGRLREARCGAVTRFLQHAARHASAGTAAGLEVSVRQGRRVH